LDIVPRAQKPSIQLEIEPDLPEISVDENRIEQILSNLVNSAIKYNREGGTVTPRATKNTMVDDLAKKETACIQIAFHLRQT